MNTPLPNENESSDNISSFNDNEINPAIKEIKLAGFEIIRTKKYKK